MTTTRRTIFATGGGLSRRALLNCAGAAALRWRVGGAFFRRRANNTLKVGFISPRTGRSAASAKPTATAGCRRKSLASGFAVGDKTFDVKISRSGTQFRPSRAGQLAKGLINSAQDRHDAGRLHARDDQPGGRTPARRPRAPCLSTVMPWEAWYFGAARSPARPRRSNGPTTSASASKSSTRPTSRSGNLIPTNKKVGVLYPNDADGNAIRQHLAPALAKDGFTIVDAGPYEDARPTIRADRDVQEGEV